jgi:hypothetical protein
VEKCVTEHAENRNKIAGCVCGAINLGIRDGVNRRLDQNSVLPRSTSAKITLVVSSLYLLQKLTRAKISLHVDFLAPITRKFSYSGRKQQSYGLACRGMVSSHKFLPIYLHSVIIFRDLCD